MDHILYLDISYAIQLVGGHYSYNAWHMCAVAPCGLRSVMCLRNIVNLSLFHVLGLRAVHAAVGSG